MRMARSLIGLLPVGLLFGAAPVRAQPPGHGFHPPMNDQQYHLQCRLDTDGQPTVVDVPLHLPSPAAAADLDQLVELPAPLAPIRVRKYLPRAVLEQEIVPDESRAAPPAVEVSIDGPTQSFQRWLVAADPERDRLISFIGTWRYQAVDGPQQRDQLFAQFKNEFTRPPRLFVRRAKQDKWIELPAQAGTTRALGEPDCTVRVKRFMPDFGLDAKTKKPVNQSEQRLNPAALVEIEHQGRSEERWVFAKFPEYSTRKAGALPFQITLDCPQQKQGSTPDFMLMTVGRAEHELWTRHAGKLSAKTVDLDQPSEIAGSQYTFRVVRFVPYGQLREVYRPTEGREAVSALQIETVSGSGGSTTMWLELGKQRVLQTAVGPLAVAFGPHAGDSAKGHR